MLVFKKSNTDGPKIENPDFNNYLNTIPPNIYQQSLELRTEYERQRREYVVKIVSEKYPTNFVLLYSFVTIAIGLAEIALQIVSIINKGALYFVGSGIWGGCYCILLGLLALSLIKWKNYSLIYLNFVANSTLSLVITSLITINALGVSYYFRKSSKQPNREMLPITISMLVLGVMATIMCIFYLVMMCKIGFARRRIVNPTISLSSTNDHQLTFMDSNYYPNLNKMNSGFYV